jgi:transcriptional regulator with PAS, ATPase and Fis domain
LIDVAGGEQRARRLGEWLGGIMANSRSRLVWLSISLALVLSGGACHRAQSSFAGEWEVAEGLHLDSTTTDSPPSWRRLTFPLKFETPGPGSQGWVTCRKQIPSSDLPQVGTVARLTLYSGTVSDVSRFFWNGVEIGGQGSQEPYRSGAAKRVLAQLPHDLRPVNELRVALYTTGNFPLDLADPDARIDDTHRLYAWYHGRETIHFALLTLFVAVGLYHLLLAAYRSGERGNLYFGLFCLVASLYWFFLSGARDAVFDDPGVRWRVELGSLFGCGVLMAQFLSQLLFGRQHRWLWLYCVVSLLAAVALLVDRYAIWKGALRIWQVSSLVLAVWLVIECVRRARERVGLRYLLVSLIVFLGAVIHDVLCDMGVFQSEAVAKYAFALLLISVAAGLAHRSMLLQRAMGELNSTLDRKVSDRTAQLSRALAELRQKLRAEETAVKLADMLATKEVERKVIEGRSLVYHSAPMREAMSTLERYAQVPAPVLITGETGTGKELFARFMHERSRLGKPFIAVNCAAIPATLWEGEVFGHAAGAYTDARVSRAGLIARAADGSLLFDEVGEIPPPMQAKMLRVLEEGSFTALGAEQPTAIRCRFLFATNRPLVQMAKDGLFRTDLLYRINTLQIRLPPLRERKEDITHLVSFFLETYARKLGVEVTAIDDAALRHLDQHEWPGNVRELENVIVRALAVATDQRIRDADIQLSHNRHAAEELADAAGGHDGDLLASSVESGSPGFKALMADHAEKLITEALARSNGNLNQAARTLGLRRSSLDYRIRALGIKVSRPGDPISGERRIGPIRNSGSS